MCFYVTHIKAFRDSYKKFRTYIFQALEIQQYFFKNHSTRCAFCLDKAVVKLKDCFIAFKITKTYIAQKKKKKRKESISHPKPLTK